MSQAVYGIIINGRVWYVGSSKNFKKRKIGHKSSFNGAKGAQPFHRWARERYIWSDLVFVVLERPTVDRLLERETYYYDKFRDTIHPSCQRPIRDPVAAHRKAMAYLNETVICECGDSGRRRNAARHRRSHLHKLNMARLLALQKMSDNTNGVQGRSAEEKETDTTGLQSGRQRSDDGSSERIEEDEKSSSDESAQQGEVQ